MERLCGALPSFGSSPCSDDSDSDSSNSELSEEGRLPKSWTLTPASDVSLTRFARSLVCFCIMSVVYVVLSLFSGMFVYRPLPEDCVVDAAHHRCAALVAWLAALMVLVIIGLFIYLQKDLADRSPLIADVERYMVLRWLFFISLSGFFLTEFPAKCVRASTQRAQENFASWLVSHFVGASLALVYMRAMEKRIYFIEKRLDKQLWSNRIGMFRFAVLWLCTGCIALTACFRLRVLMVAQDQVQETMLIAKILDVVGSLGFGLASLVLAVLVFKAFVAPLSTTAAFATSQTGIYTFAEASWAHRILARLRLCMVLPLTITGVGLVARCVAVTLLHERYIFSLPLVLQRVCSMVVESACLLPMLGLFHEQHPQLPEATNRALLAPLTGTVDKGHEERHTALWTAKVRELAGRSIDVGSLLSFHAKLGSAAVMPSYDPWRSTTNDVVRQAIIPLSRIAQGRGGKAYSVLHSSQDRVPLAECMVTHTWSSLFVDLVAAVVADALGIAQYAAIAEGLAGGHHKALRRKLHARGTLQQTYWICAFCINQHCSICGSFPAEPQACMGAHAKWDAARRDTVTGEVFALCDCREPKFLNDLPDVCELNKFDQMMALLQDEVPGFHQLVVVDREFAVFSRVWCVAELVEANFSRIEQRVQLCSSAGLHDDAEDLELYIRLATLTVARAEASRPEDKDAILARIPSVREFDAQLQAVIFGEYGLLNRRFVGFGVVEAAANIARRLQVLQRRSSAMVF